jgi:hypothetical protein
MGVLHSQGMCLCRRFVLCCVLALRLARACRHVVVAMGSCKPGEVCVIGCPCLVWIRHGATADGHSETAGKLAN